MTAHGACVYDHLTECFDNPIEVGELMRQIHNDSIHSATDLASSLVSDDDHQMTVMRRDGAIPQPERTQLANLFGRENGNA
ncbi:hypothetical protein TELCIR_15971 [Teladorsagia circumcincta]|uniref:Uncharacterized protein n=2 Tax=Teladorsagia circumcincta TaxID=45464 RepID=A0A2G9TX01_TELCI|nr:hypothetical protein TELCIR_15971 [Teladorsagia circumcincta]